MLKRYIPFLLFICACNTAPENKNVTGFYQLKEFIQSQTVLLQKNNFHLLKTIIKDGKEESKSIENPDWQKELRPFADCDLNKPAWKKSYKADTFYHENKTHVLYEALESKLSVRKLEIVSNKDSVYLIDIHLEKQNSYYRSMQHLQYYPGKSYSITGSQKVILADSTTFNIKAIFK